MTGARRTQLIAAFLGAGLFLAYYTLYLFREDLKPWQIYRVRFAKVIGLKEKDDVEIAGDKIGRVKRVDLSKDSNVATLQIEPGINLREGATATIEAASLFGDVKITIVNGQGRRRLGIDDEIPGGYQVSVGAADRNTQLALKEGLRALAEGTDKLLRGEGGFVGDMLSDRDRRQGMHDYFDQLENTAKGARETLERVRRGELLGGIVDRDVAENVRGALHGARETLEDARDLVQQASRGVGRLGAIAGDPETGEATRETVARAARSLAAYRRSDLAEAPLHYAAHDDALYRRLVDAAEGLGTTTGQAARGEGVFGALTSDQGGRDFKTRLASFDEGMEDALNGRGLSGQLIKPGPEQRRAMDQLVGRVQTAIAELKHSMNGLRQGTSVSTLHGALFTVF